MLSYLRVTWGRGGGGACQPSESPSVNVSANLAVSATGMSAGAPRDEGIDHDLSQS